MDINDIKMDVASANICCNHNIRTLEELRGALRSGFICLKRMIGPVRLKRLYAIAGIEMPVEPFKLTRHEVQKRMDRHRVLRAIDGGSAAADDVVGEIKRAGWKLHVISFKVSPEHLPEVRGDAKWKRSRYFYAGYWKLDGQTVFFYCEPGNIFLPEDPLCTMVDFETAKKLLGISFDK